MSQSFDPARSVRHDPGKCSSCSACVTRCPTEALRLRGGSVMLSAERCIDCGECLRACPSGAREAATDPLSAIDGFRTKVAVPAPALYGQFEGLRDAEAVAAGLYKLGFDEVFDAVEAAGLVKAATVGSLAGQGREAASGEGRPPVPAPRPLLSSACPAVVRLVRLRFPELVPNLVPVLPPMEAAARIVRDALHRGESGVGVFFITPCAGKATAARSPLGYPRSALDGVIGIKDLFGPLKTAVDRGRAHGGSRGRRLAFRSPLTEEPGGASFRGRTLTVEGLENVIEALSRLANGEFSDLLYIEALACASGCAGGPLGVERAEVAKDRMREMEAVARRVQCGAPAARPEAGLPDEDFLLKEVCRF